jgi:cytochrome c-type biogenesis protein
MMWQIFSVFGAGLMASLSPCVYPMLPITVGYLGVQTHKDNARQRILLFFVGQVLTFTAMGLIAVRLGEIFGFTSQSSQVHLIVGGFLVLFGILSWFNYLPGLLLRFNGGAGVSRLTKKESPLFPLIVGASTALVASPCASPILGSVLTTLAQEGSYLRGVVLMVSYAVGASLLFLIVGLGALRFHNLPRAGAWMSRLHRVASLLILAVGLYYLYLGIFDA